MARGKKGEWHLKWQDWFFNHGCSIEKKINKNRADVVLPNGVVIELQESPISNDEIKKRESAYEKMIWLFNIERIREKPLLSNETMFWDNRKRPMRTTKQGVLLQSGYGNPMYKIIYWNDGDYYGRYEQIDNDDLMQIVPYKIGNLILVKIEYVDEDREDRNAVYSLYNKGIITLSKLEQLLHVIYNKKPYKETSTEGQAQGWLAHRYRASTHGGAETGAQTYSNFMIEKISGLILDEIRNNNNKIEKTILISRFKSLREYESIDIADLESTLNIMLEKKIIEFDGDIIKLW